MEERLKAAEAILIDLISRCGAMEAMQKLHIKLSFVILISIIGAACIVLVEK